MTVYTKEMLKNQLREMGFTGTEAVMVHSSMKAIGEVEGGADTVVDAFMEYFKDGLFMTPTHTWAQMNEEYCEYDPKTEPACVGIIPNIFRNREGVVRSLHPTHSIAAFGNDAAEYIKGEENATTPCPPSGCWGRLLERNAKILLVGVTHARNTFIHAVEEMFDVPERLTEEPTIFWVKMPDGSKKEVAMYRHYNRIEPHISERFDKMRKGYEVTGAAKQVKFGDADCILCDCRRLYEVTERILKQEINCFIEREEIPSEWYEIMEIRQTRPEELEQVLDIYAYARQFMENHGNPNQWKKTNPPKERVEKDIEEGKSYVCVKGEELLGVFYFAIEEDPTYSVIYDGAWKSNRKYGVVHRIASAGKEKGVGSFCMNWAYKQIPNIRIDTHHDNVVMQNMLKKNGFSYCGIIHLENGEERFAFQKC